jgi:4,5-DOPA dioxygenase extradiol
MRRDEPDFGHAWGIRFDQAAKEKLESAPRDILSLASHPDYAMAVPAPDHYIPMLYIAGMAAAEGEPLKVWNEGHALGAVSMTSYALGLDDAALAKVRSAAMLEPA